MAKLQRTCSSIKGLSFVGQNQIQRKFTSYLSHQGFLRNQTVDARTNNRDILVTPLITNSQCYKFNSTTSPVKQETNLCEKHSLKVPSRGAGVVVRTPIDASIISSDPGQYQNLDEAFVRLYKSREAKNPASQPSLSIEHRKDDNLSIECAAKNESDIVSDYELNVEIPIVYNIKASAVGNANIHVSEFIETKFVDIETVGGEVKINKLRSENIKIKTHTGNVTCDGALQGNVCIKTNKGNITSNKRFIGPSAELETEDGDIRISSSYSDINKFTTDRGSLNLKNIHNESHITVTENGNVTMQGLDGHTNIFVKKGNLDIQISRLTGDSRIHVVDGNLHLKLSDSHPMNVTIDAKEIMVDDKFGKQGKINPNDKDGLLCFTTSEQPQLSSESLAIRAENGKVSVEIQDWATSIGFKLPSMS